MSLKTTQTSRRNFLKTSGSMTVYFSIAACSNQISSFNGAAESLKEGAMTVDNWLQLTSSGEVILSLGKVELGQGIGTALAQLAAEELLVNFERITLAPVDTQGSPDEAYTFSSISVQQSGPKVKAAASAAYQTLRQSAAEKLAVNANSIAVVNGVISSSEKTTDLTYWDLLSEQQIIIDAEQVANLEVASEPRANQVVGQSTPRIDIPAKVFGGEAFIQDMRMPEMLHARVVRPPAPRATLDALNLDGISDMPGYIETVRDGNFVAVVAEQENQARKIARALSNNLTWSSPGDLHDQSKLYDWLRKAPSKEIQVIEPIVANNSSSQTDSVERMSAVYQRPYQCHASISPSAGIALFEQNNLTVWSHAQGMYPLRDSIALTLGLETDKVRCIHREASGCYGHNGADDAAIEAAAIAMRLPGKPIRLQWERSDEFLWEPFGSAMQIEVSAQLDSNATIRDWQYDVWSASHSGRPTATAAGNFLYAQHKADPLPIPEPRAIPQPNGGADRNAVPLYVFESMQVNKHILQEVPLRTSSLRGLGAYANVFAIESFVDELALKAQQDPLAFRIKHLQDERAIAVLKELGDVSHWSQRPAAGTGVGWGVGFAQFKNLSSYLAMAMLLEVDQQSGDIKLNKAIAVCDAGLVINPDGLKAQIEGGIIQSASWTLKEQATFNTQQVTSHDWIRYPILRFDEVPEVEVHILENKADNSVGVGETAQGPAAAAIANAVAHASGQRLRELPLKPIAFSASS